MNSCLYECHVMHARFQPRAHRFLYRIFLFAIDLDELPPMASRIALFSLRRRNVYSFRDSDFLPVGEPLHNGSSGAADRSRAAALTPPLPLKDRVIAYAGEHGVDLKGGRVVLVTLPRVFGHLFNPVSFYFCYDRHGAPAAAIAEVTNTFREVKPYFLGPDCRTQMPLVDGQKRTTPAAPDEAIEGGLPSSAQFRRRTPKHFYVSPYSDVDVAFDFALRTPGARLSIQIDDFAGAARTLTSTLTGTRRALTSLRLAWYTVKYPLITLRVVALIHWHALLLWRKRVPWFAKSARPADQRSLYRPHQSLQPSDVA